LHSTIRLPAFKHFEVAPIYERRASTLGWSVNGLRRAEIRGRDGASRQPAASFRSVPLICHKKPPTRRC